MPAWTLQRLALGCGFQRAFFDIRVFNPFAQTNTTMSMASVYLHHEKEKQRAYQQRVCEIERGSFTPLVFSASGGMGKAAEVTDKRLGVLLADKRHEP